MRVCTRMCTHVSVHVCVSLHARACCRQGKRLLGRYGAVGPEQGWRVPRDPLHVQPAQLSLVEIPAQGWAEVRVKRDLSSPVGSSALRRVLKLRPAFERPNGAEV